MKRDEVKEVFKVIVNIYPQFEVSADKIDTWHKLLKKDNPAVVMRNVERHALDKKFPPTIADIREVKKEAYSNSFLEKRKQWEENASGGK